MAIKLSRQDRALSVFVHVFLVIFGMSCLFPVMHVISISISEESAILSGRVGIWPVGFSRNGYFLLLRNTPIIRAFWNNIQITVVGTVLRLFFTILAAYPLSKSYMWGRRTFSMAIVFTMIFNAGLIPHYLLIRNLGLMNTYAAIWLPGLIGVYNLMILRTFFEGISKDLEDAADIDGATEWRKLWQLFVPLAKPALAALTLFASVNLWNSFRNVLLYITDVEKHNMAVLVQQLIRSSTMTTEEMLLDSESNVERVQAIPEAVQAAGIVVMLVPMMLVYPWLQKYFVKGVMIGAIKG